MLTCGVLQSAWILQDQIWPYSEFKSTFMITHRVPPGFTEAIELIEQEMAEEPEQETVSCMLILYNGQSVVLSMTTCPKLKCLVESTSHRVVLVVVCHSDGV